MSILLVVGARPNYVKAAAVARALRARGLAFHVLDTGQHKGRAMRTSFCRDLDFSVSERIPRMDRSTPMRRLASIMICMERRLERLRPGVVLLFGDVDSTVACALAAARARSGGLPVLAHAEAGLRSWDMRMPEETNRIATDHLSDLLFVSEPSGARNLRREGVPPNRIIYAGNTMIDTLIALKPAVRRSAILERLGVKPRGYAVMTVHRHENLEDAGRMEGILEGARRSADRLPIIFPVHPGTRARLQTLGISAELQGVRTMGPLGYADFIKLIWMSRVALTDSGGVQEETAFLGVPCVTLRENTERPSTIARGTNTLAGTDSARIESAVRRVLRAKTALRPLPPGWDGRASERIARKLAAIAS